LRWLPWKWIVRRAARAYGFIDPLAILARMERFSQPAEVAQPMELLRAGLIFHARGLVNTKAIQHNLDWVWPYWVVRQFDPGDASFIPRAFSFSHVNLTHRNWTAVGLPDCPHYPIVDPRGLVTPFHDGWSIDCWILPEHQAPLLPAQATDAEQHWALEPTPTVVTRTAGSPGRLGTGVRVVRVDGRARLRIEVEAHASPGDWLAVAIRPYNPEGVQFIDELAPLAAGGGIRVNDRADVHMTPAPERLCFERYSQGDVYHALPHGSDSEQGLTCPVGMATGAGLYRLDGDGHRRVWAEVPLEGGESAPREPVDWRHAHAGSAALDVSDGRVRFLFDAARTSMVLHSVDDIVPGPYTYRRFWFRDACLIAHALLCCGYTERARAALARFPARQGATGYFQSQEGEWDSNGQVLWIFERFAALTGEVLPPEWLDAVERGVRWIARKRLSGDAGEGIAGLLPAGFSAEHLGPNDYYYWDDWWAIAGLRGAARVLADGGRDRAARRAANEAASLRAAVDASLASLSTPRCRGGIPAAPGRRMDAGAVGSLVADYPLHETGPGDHAIMATAEYLIAHSFHEGGFFQNMIHSGINAYLTLAIAQTLLRAGQAHRAWPLIRTVGELASPTGQWPEAIHPRTGGGCMGDGHHVWASAEWAMAIRALFVRAEGDTLVIGSGLPPEWLDAGRWLRFGPTPTDWGPVSVAIGPGEGGLVASVTGRWRDRVPRLRACVPGHRETDLAEDGSAVALPPKHA